MQVCTCDYATDDVIIIGEVQLDLSGKRADTLLYKYTCGYGLVSVPTRTQLQ